MCLTGHETLTRHGIVRRTVVQVMTRRPPMGMTMKELERQKVPPVRPAIAGIDVKYIVCLELAVASICPHPSQNSANTITTANDPNAHSDVPSKKH